MDWLVKKANDDTERTHLNRILREIKAAIDGLVSGSSAAWGSITGTLSAQTDLQTALNAKENAGVAATLDAAHVAALDPHPQYLTAAEGNAAYAPIGSGGGVAGSSGTWLLGLANDGTDGFDGAPGQRGATGSTGPAGADGRAGPALFMLAQDGLDGADGTPGPRGQAGATGNTGATGSDGRAGPALFMLPETYEQESWPTHGNLGTASTYDVGNNGSAGSFVPLLNQSQLFTGLNQFYYRITVGSAAPTGGYEGHVNLTGTIYSGGLGTAYGVISDLGGDSSPTVDGAVNFESRGKTNAGFYTYDFYNHFRATEDVFNGTMTEVVGFRASPMTYGVSNYAFKGEVASGANRWNLYMDGTAPNHLAGKLLVGSAVDDGVNALQVTGLAVVNTAAPSSRDRTAATTEFVHRAIGSTAGMHMLASDGLDGLDGMPGARGADGATGPAGAGIQGQPGAALFMLAQDGETGESGPPGPPGNSGPQGVGIQGPTGPALFMMASDGQDGLDGIPGPQGRTGSNGAQGPVGAALFMLAQDGAEGDAGPPGPRGATGAQGPAGAAGAGGGTTIFLPSASESDGESWAMPNNANVYTQEVRTFGNITTKSRVVSSMYTSEGITTIASGTPNTMYFQPDGPTSSTGRMSLTGGGTLNVANNVEAVGGFFSTAGIMASTTGTVFLGTTGAGTVYLRPGGYSSSTGQTSITSTGDMSVSGTISGVGSVTSSGALSAFWFNNRTGAVNSYAWYADADIVRLYSTSTGDIFTITSTGAFSTFNGAVGATAFRATATSPYTTGSGVETYLNAGTGYVLSFNRTSTAYLPLYVIGSTVTLWAGAVSMVGVSSTGMTVAGDVTVNRGATTGGLFLDSNAGVAADVRFFSGGSLRWVVRKNSAAESGGNVGSNFDILARDDAGGALSVPVSITRSTGTINTLALSATGTIAASSAITAGAAVTGTESNATDIANHTGGSMQALQANASGAATILFHRSGAWATYFGLDTDNKFRYGGFSEGAASYKFWTESDATITATNFTASSTVSGVNITGTNVYPSSAGGAYFSGNGAGIQMNGQMYIVAKPAYLSADSAGWYVQPRTYVQSTDPGAAAGDGDLWIW